jgi:ketosteroid isomerase-like protein
MLRGRHIPVFLALFVGACTPAPEPMTLVEGTPLSPEEVASLSQEVSEAVHGLTEAMNSHDPEAVFGFYRQDDSFFYLGCTSSLAGWGTFATRVGSFYTYETEVTFQREVLSIQILSPTVAVAGLRGGSTETEGLYWTEVLQKDAGGRWLITYEHESWPGCPEPRAAHLGTEGMGEME